VQSGLLNSAYSADSGHKQNRLYGFFHSDGNIWNLSEQMVDAGFYCLHCIDAQAEMDLYKLREVYGKRITFMRHIDLFAWSEDKIKLKIEQAVSFR
jgi:hypothetical protein